MGRHHQLACLIIQLSALFSPGNCLGESAVSMLITQTGLDHFAHFLTTLGSGVLENSDLALDVHTGEDEKADAGTLAMFDVGNIVDLGQLNLLLVDEQLLIMPRNFALKSEVNVTAEMWPLPVTEETVHLLLKFREAAFGLGTERSDDRDPNGPVKFKLTYCSFSDATIDAATENYWLFDTSMKIGGYMVQKNMDSILCPQLKSAISSINSKLNGTVALRNLVNNEEQLLEGLRDAVAHYYLSDASISDGIMAIKTNINWYRNNSEGDLEPVTYETPSLFEGSFSRESRSSSEQDITAFQFDLTQGRRQHLTVWVSENVVNDALNLLNWDAKLLNASIPVTSEILPNNSRRFFSTMCLVCYFDLFVWSKGAPSIMASETNKTLELMLSLDVKMWVVNPDQGTSSMFMSFMLGMHIHLNPYMKDGTLRIGLDLANVTIQMSDEASAFPPEWSFFIEDLVQSMIQDVIWMQVKEKTKMLVEDEGIPFAKNCGIDADSVELKIEDGRFGLAADLQLDQFNLDKCQQNLAEALPKLNGTAL